MGQFEAGSFGIPPGVETDDEKRVYVESYEREEGICLDPSLEDREKQGST